ncbi:MAG: substrate-binding domain-containing protein [Anaerolineaceae bacterium]|nr:substrate-binding domain-containing protein [Anaerolineaceae bacterium]
MEEYVWISELAHHPVFVAHAHPILHRLASHYGVLVTIAGPDDDSLEAYLQAIDDAVRRKVAGIMVIGWGDRPVASAIDRAVEAGIPVVTTDSDVPHSKRLAHVGTNWFRMGQAMAEQLGELMGGQGKVLMLGMRGLQNMESGFRGFMDRISHYPKIQLLGPEDDLDVRFDKARAIVASYLKKHPDLKGIAGFDGNSGPGAALALEKAGRQESVSLVCVDADEPQLKHLRTRAIDVAFCQKRAAFTYLAFQMLYTYNHGSLTTGYRRGIINIPGNIDTGFIEVTRKNADTFETELNLDEAFTRHELSQQLALVSSMIENIDQVALATDLEGRIVYANPAASRLCGYEAGQLQTLFLERILDFDDRRRQQVAECVGRGRSANFETRARRKDGSAFPVQVSMSPLAAGEGVRGTVVFAVDITKRKQAEEALRQRMNLEKLIATMSTEFINLPAEEVDPAIDKALARLGRFVGVDRSYVFRFRDDTTKMDNTHEWCDEGIQPHIGRLQGLASDEYRLMMAKLRRFETMLVSRVADLPEGSAEKKEFQHEGIQSLMLVPMVLGGSLVGFVGFDSVRRERTWPPEVISLLGTVGDIFANALERRRAEQTLRESETRFRNIVESSPLGMLVYELSSEGQLVLVSANPAANEILGTDCNQFVGLAIEEAFPGLAETDLPDRYREVAGSGIPWHTDEFPYDHGGIRGVFEVHVDQMSPGGIVVSFRDITEKEQLEAQLLQAQKMEAVGRLAGGVAHDFNNQLTVIKGYSDLLLAELREGDPLGESLREIRNAAARAERLTNQLLTFSRRQVLRPLVINLNEVITEMQNPLARIIGEDIEIKVLTDPQLGNVRADRSQVEQAIMNLAINARDAMPEGGRLTIETTNIAPDDVPVQTRSELAPGPHIMLAVSDTGVGMDKATRERVFEPFFTTKEVGKGTGLGLSIVYRQSGGSLYVYSEPGQGTTVKIFLPQVAEEAETAPQLDSVAPSHRGSETILVAEDEETVRQLIVRVLRSQGYTVLEAGRADEAIPLGEHYRGDIHMLITDIVMPQMQGPELADRLRDARPGLRVLYITGYTANAVIDRRDIDPEVNLLTKPFSPNALAMTVRRMLDDAPDGGDT